MLKILHPKIWIYKMKDKYKKCSEEEVKISKDLTLKKRLTFLESRSYIREAIAHYYNCDPLDVPLVAEPGQPPLLMDNLGEISISHCNDALIFSLFNEKIGVDIERSDRQFNHTGIAKRYFYHYKNNILTREEVLSDWTIIEAAIKWDKGKLSEDLCSWEIQKKKKQALNKKKNISVNFSQFSFLDWTISLAYEGANIRNNILCNNIFI